MSSSRHRGASCPFNLGNMQQGGGRPAMAGPTGLKTEETRETGRVRCAYFNPTPGKAA